MTHGATKARAHLLAYVRSAPTTYVYFAILLVTTCAISATDARSANRFLLSQSTNLNHLASDPLPVLVSSAFWLASPEQLAGWAVLFTLVLAPVERRVGGWRLGGVFALGHVGATLVTAAGVWIALRLDLVERRIADARDVGASYGFLAVAAALVYLLHPALRRPYAAALLGLVAADAAIQRDFTGYGHVAAVVIGFACFGLVARPRGRPPAPVGEAVVRAWRERSARRLSGRSGRSASSP